MLHSDVEQESPKPISSLLWPLMPRCHQSGRHDVVVPQDERFLSCGVQWPIRADLDGSPAYLPDFLRCLSSADNSAPTFSFSSLNVTSAVTFHVVMPCDFPFHPPARDLLLTAWYPAFLTLEMIEACGRVVSCLLMWISSFKSRFEFLLSYSRTDLALACL